MSSEQRYALEQHNTSHKEASKLVELDAVYVLIIWFRRDTSTFSSVANNQLGIASCRCDFMCVSCVNNLILVLGDHTKRLWVPKRITLD